MPPFKDENILIIAPGSQTTLAQLGLPESFTPAARRFPSRVFPLPDGKTFEPNKVRSRKKTEGSNGNTNIEVFEDELEYYEDPEDEEGAIYPLKEGRIENMPAFFALLQHIHSTLGPQLHTPILLIAQPCWTAKNHEDLTQFIFEKFKTPALCIMDSALATLYAFGIPNGTIVDVGFEKVDVTAIVDFQMCARGTVPHSGGEAMTRRLMELLKSKGFNRDMAEQLKKSMICEVLPPGTPMPGTAEAGTDEVVITNPAAAASTGALSSGPDVKITEPPQITGLDSEMIDDEPGLEEKLVDEDGVLDVASILTSGKTQEFIAKAEKAKAEKAAKKEKRDAEKAEAAAAAAKPARLPNSKRPRAMFHYEENVSEAPATKRQKTPEPPVAQPVIEEPVSAVEAKPMGSDGFPSMGGDPAEEAARREKQKAARKEERRKIREEENPDRVRRDIEIGLERFQVVEGGLLDSIADTIHRTILSVRDISKRQDAWDALVICGSGSKVRGFKDALLTTLNNRYLISPSSATMFMSELPSNLATPSGTGSQTPLASYSMMSHAPPTASAVNPLLYAATTASNPALNPNLGASYAGHGAPAHSSHSQSPTSIKLASPPAYFPEWKQYDEAVFLGAQVAGKVIFVVDQGLSKGFLSRVEFNEDGPNGIHQSGLVM